MKTFYLWNDEAVCVGGPVAFRNIEQVRRYANVWNHNFADKGQRIVLASDSVTFASSTEVHKV